jgi:hypothetical protein
MCTQSCCRRWTTLWIDTKLVRCCACCVAHYSLKVVSVHIVHALVTTLATQLLLVVVVVAALLAEALALAAIPVYYLSMKAKLNMTAFTSVERHHTCWCLIAYHIVHVHNDYCVCCTVLIAVAYTLPLSPYTPALYMHLCTLARRCSRMDMHSIAHAISHANSSQMYTHHVYIYIRTYKQAQFCRKHRCSTFP